MTNQKNTTRYGLKAGLIIAAIYVLMLWIRFTFFDFNPFAFFLCRFISYAIFLIGLALVAVRKRNNQGGYAEIKDLFRPLFIVILISEISFFAFTFIYLNYINPGFFKEFEQSMIAFASSTHKSMKDLQPKLDDIRQQDIVKSNFWFLLKNSLFTDIVKDSIFGLMISFFLRKKTPQQLMEMHMSKQTFKP